MASPFAIDAFLFSEAERMAGTATSGTQNSGIPETGGAGVSCTGDKLSRRPRFVAANGDAGGVTFFLGGVLGTVFVLAAFDLARMSSVSAMRNLI